MNKAATAAACVAAVVGGATPAISSSPVASLSPALASEKYSESTSTIPYHVATKIRGGAAQEDPSTSDADKYTEKKKKKKRRKSKSPKLEKKAPSARTESAAEKRTEESEPAASAAGETSSKDTSTETNNHDQPATSIPKASTHVSHQERIVKEILMQDDYYAVLGVARTATSAEIQKAYRRRCVLTHPDKMTSGDRKAFDKVAEAYDVLSDESKRSIYNQFGKEGVKRKGHGKSSFQQDLFSSFFGMRPQHPRQPRNRTVRYQLDVTLEDLYNGFTRPVILEQGLSPQRKKEVEVHVPRGMSSGESITLAGEMDHVPNASPADVIFLLAQRPHKVFTRKGHDLAIELEISLEEAICGVTRSIKHLDGRVINVVSARHNDKEEPVVIETGDVQVLKGEGMPKRVENTVGDVVDDATSRSDFGDLYVQYKVKMPPPNAAHNKLTPEERQELGKLLSKLEGGPSKNKTEVETETGDGVHLLERASASDFGRASGPFRMEEDTMDPHLQEDERHVRPNFPSFARQFHYYSSGNPFFGGGFSDFTDDEDGNVQCQQM